VCQGHVPKYFILMIHKIVSNLNVVVLCGGAALQSSTYDTWLKMCIYVKDTLVSVRVCQRVEDFLQKLHVNHLVLSQHFISTRLMTMPPAFFCALF
jgi:hypothetical protein